MGTVHGQVVCKESGLGVQGLVIEALDVPRLEITPAVAPTAAGKARRLATGFTGPDGNFRLTFEQPQGDTNPINLLILVSGPEATGQEPTITVAVLWPRLVSQEIRSLS